MVRRSPAVLAAALLLLIPVASATWYVHGTAEPDTAQDVQDGFMFHNPDVNPNPSVRQAYFNVWADADVIGVNPNVGATGSGIFTSPNIRFSAMLGVWKDCNRDGFVGAADGALWEYRRELLAGVPNTPCSEANGHLVGEWVWEFHWIGPFDAGRPGALTCPGNQPETAECFHRLFGPQGYYNDTDSRVWGDWGLPGATPPASCTVLPPAGMTASTGGLIDYADCHANRRFQNAVNGADPNGNLGLRMDGQPQTSGSLLNQQLPHLWHDPYHPDSTGLYERDTGDAAFTTWDCDNSGSVPVSQRTPVRDEAGLLPQHVWVNNTGVIPNYYVTTLKGDDGTIVAVGAINLNYTMPAPSLTNPQGSYYDALNHTRDGALGHCGDGGSLPYANPESDSGTVDPNVKGRNEHDIAFRFRSTQGFPLISLNYNAIGGCTGTSNGQPFPPGCENYPTRDTFPINMPKDFGLTAHRGLNFIIPGVINSPGGIGWRATAPEPADPQIVSRETLQPQGPIYATFYATLGQGSLSRGVSIAGAASLYGQEWCEGTWSGVKKGFDCNPNNWWDPINHPGTSAMPRQTGGFISSTCTTGLEQPMQNCREVGVKASQTYHLRDIDCWDGRVARGAPVYASLVAFSGQDPCGLAP